MLAVMVDGKSGRDTYPATLTMLGIIPDPATGRFTLPIAVALPGVPPAAPVSKFYLRDGRLFDGFNHEWTAEEFEAALRGAGLFPLQPKPDGIHCVQCGRNLKPPQERFCGEECRKEWKRGEMRRKRSKGHRCVCGICGNVMKVGRPHL
jgi:hypothetical protein